MLACLFLPTKVSHYMIIIYYNMFLLIVDCKQLQWPQHKLALILQLNQLWHFRRVCHSIKQKVFVIRKCLRACAHTLYLVWKQCGYVIIIQLYEITSVVPQAGMLGWAASVHCLTERFHSAHSSHWEMEDCSSVVAPPGAEEGDDNWGSSQE